MIRLRTRTKQRRRLIAAGVALILLIAGVWTVQAVRQSTREALLLEARAEGMAAVQAGQWNEALTPLSFYLTHEREDVEALLAFAEARSKVPEENDRHLEEALMLYRAALDRGPQNLDLLEPIMLLSERLGRRIEAMDAAGRLLAREPAQIEALRIRAVGLAFDSRFEDASNYTRRLIELEPDQIAWRALHLRILRESGWSHEQLLALAEQWADAGPEDGRYHMIQAHLWAEAGDRDRAAAAAREAVQRGAADREVLERLVSLLDAMMLRHEADALLSDTRQRFPTEQWTHEAAVRRLWRAGRIDEALAEIYDAADAHGSLDRDLLRWKGLLHLLQKDHEAAQAALQEYLHAAGQTEPGPSALGASRQPTTEGGREDNQWAEAALAGLEDDPADWRSALEAYRNAAAMNPDEPILQMLLADSWTQAGEHELAALTLQRAVASDPGWLAAQTLYAQTLLRLGRNEQAARLAARLVQRTVEPPVELYLLLSEAWQASDLSAADLGLAAPREVEKWGPAAIVEVVFEHSPDHHHAIEMMARGFLEQGDEASFIALAESIAKRETAEAQSLVALAALSLEYDAGVEESLLGRAVSKAGLTPRAAAIKARMLHRRGETDAARDVFEHAEGGAAAVQRARAEYLSWAGDPAAAAALRTLLEMASNDPGQAAFVLGQTAAWEHASLVDEAIDRLASLVGEGSPRVALARAARVVRFNARDSAAIARAMSLVNEVLRSSPPGAEPVDALQLMAVLHLTEPGRDRGAATRFLRQAVAAHPGRVDLYPLLIMLLQQQGDFHAAEEYLTRLGERSRGNEGLRRAELQLLEAQGDFRTIVARLTEQVQREAATPAERLALATALRRAGQPDEAWGIYQALLQSDDPDSSGGPGPAVVRAAAELKAAIGEIEKAESLLKDYARHDASGEGAVLLGQFCQRHGRAADAERWFRRAAEVSPRSAEAWLHLAGHYLDRTEYHEARKAAANGLRVQQAHPDLLTIFTLASIHIGGPDRREALSLLDALDCYHESLVAALRLYDRITNDQTAGVHGSDSRARRRAGAGLEEVHRLVEDYPYDVRAWRLAIVIHAQAGEVAEAVHLARQAASRFPARPEPAEMAARLLLGMGRLAEARDQALVWRSRSLHAPLQADVVIAAVDLDLDRPDDAIERLEPLKDRIVAGRETHPEHLLVLLRALGGSGRYEQLLPIAQAITAEDEDGRWARVLLEGSAAAPPSAAEDLLSLLGESPWAAAPDAMLELGAAWLNLAERGGGSEALARARELAEGAATASPGTSPGALSTADLLLAVIMERFGEADAAAAHYRRVLESDSENWIALNNLASVLLHNGGDAEEALVLSYRAVTRQPHHAAVLETHAQALLKTGQVDDAREHLERILNDSPDDPSSLVTMARLLLAEQRAPEARQWIKRAADAVERAAPHDSTLRTRIDETDTMIRNALESVQ